MAKITAHRTIQLFGGTEKLDLATGEHEVDDAKLARIFAVSPGSERLFRACCTLHPAPVVPLAPEPMAEPQVALKRGRKVKKLADLDELDAWEKSVDSGS